MATARKRAGPDMVEKLAALVGEDRVTTDDFERELYSREIANLPPEVVFVFRVKPDVVVRPASTEDVVGVVNIAREHRVPVTPRGAGSLGLGGSVPSRGGIVLDLTTMNAIEEVDGDSLSVTAQSGVTWEELRRAARRAGMRVGAYPSSALSATLGGWISTGGVGVGSYKYGTAVDQLRWLEVVLPTGKVIECGFRAVMDSASGYSLMRLFAGAEGTLGIVTRATLRLAPRAGDVVPTAYGFRDLSRAAGALRAMARLPVTPYHVGFVDHLHLANVKALGQEVPDGAGAVVTVALEGDPEEVELCDRRVADAMGSAKGGRLPDAEAEGSWEERSYEFRVKRLGPGLVPGSVFVPAPEMEAVLEKLYNAVSDLGVRAGVTGVMGDRNTVDLLPYYIVDDRKMVKNLAVMAFMKRLTDIALAHGGRPVGVGLWFAQNLGRLHGEAAVSMRQVKAALDPDGIMNPGKVVEVGTGWGLAVPDVAMHAGLELMGLLKRTLPPDTEPGELGGPGGKGWREDRSAGEGVDWGGDAGEGGSDGEGEGG